MTPAQLSDRLNARVEAVCKTLYPNGKRLGHEWVVGNTDGAAGDSLKICLAGTKIGVWADFATGESGGDLLDLWCIARNVNLKQAMNEASGWLGIAQDARESQPKKTYRRPDRPHEIRAIDPNGPVMAYLRSRGLTEITIKAFRLAEQPGRLRFPRLENNPGVIVFPYLRNNELVNCKYLALARPDGKKQTLLEGGAEPCLFGWQAVPANTRTLTITEGEIDAMTLAQQGIAAVSVPMGGGSGRKQDWIESEYDNLAQFDTINVAMDRDGPGQEAAAEIIRRLGAERCRLVEWPNPYKDANQCLTEGHFTAADFARCIHGARSLDPDELKPAPAYTGAVLHEFYPAPDTPVGLATPWAKVGDHLLFRPGEVTVWAGYSGHGKSLVLNHVAAAGLARQERFCIASMEMLPARTLFRLVRQLTGLEKPTAGYIRHCMDWLNDKLWLFDLLGTAKTERMLEVFAYAARRYQIRHYIVDSIAKCGLAEDDYNGQKALVERLVDFAHRYQAHVHLVSHTRKGADERTPPGKMDVKGTGAITDMVDNVITVWRNKPKENARAQAEAEGAAFANDKPDAALIVTKQRHSGWEGEIWLWFEPNSLQYQLQGQEAKRYVDYVAA